MKNSCQLAENLISNLHWRQTRASAIGKTASSDNGSDSKYRISVKKKNQSTAIDGHSDSVLQ